MRQNFLIRLFCLCLFPVFTMAQNTDNFRQPYPLGTKLPGSVREELHWSGVYRSDYG